MNTVFKKFATGTAALVLMTTVFGTAAMAEGNPVSTEVTGAESVVLSAVSAKGFEAVTLDGTTQTVKGAAIQSFTVTDARGAGDGWNVSVSATPFTNGDKVLSPGSVTLAVPTLEKIDPNSSAVDTVAVKGGAIDAGSVKILSAQAAGGMGGYTVNSMAMELNLKPSEAYAGTYTSTITVALTTGP